MRIHGCRSTVALPLHCGIMRHEVSAQCGGYLLRRYFCAGTDVLADVLQRVDLLPHDEVLYSVSAINFMKLGLYGSRSDRLTASVM